MAVFDIHLTFVQFEFSRLFISSPQIMSKCILDHLEIRILKSITQPFNLLPGQGVGCRLGKSFGGSWHFRLGSCKIVMVQSSIGRGIWSCPRAYISTPVSGGGPGQKLLKVLAVPYWLLKHCPGPLQHCEEGFGHVQGLMD